MDLSELVEMGDRHRRQQKPIQIGCCEAAGCLSVNSLAVHQALEAAVDEAEMGGGTPEGTVKAVQTGGPSGGCIPAAHLDAPVDYESLMQLGSIMGSGGMIVMDQSTNMVDVARFFMEFCMDKSCGKCIPCRVGTVQLHSLLTRLHQGEASMADWNCWKNCATWYSTRACVG